MRIIIPSIQVPFITGGASLHVNGLRQALLRAGHDVEVVPFLFQFSSKSYIESLIRFLQQLDFNTLNSYPIDRVIALQFPAYYVQHDHKTVWLMHQHREVYELYDPENASPELKKLKNIITDADNQAFTDNIAAIYTNSQNVSSRLEKFNHIKASPLYHPPFGEANFRCASPYPYIFYPSRLETLKRQELLIKAMQYVKTPMKAIIAGEGGQWDTYMHLIDQFGLMDKVRLIGHITEQEKYAYYAHSTAVFFGPYDEDYGYITLEAMLSAKPVITCTDSGGPLEFIRDSINGFVLPPDPKEIARKIDWLYSRPQQAVQMGESGFDLYRKKNITWDNVVTTLLN